MENNPFQQQIIDRAIAKFPSVFGLKAIPGDQFRVSRGQSYFTSSTHSTPILVIERLIDSKWYAFAKGSQAEIMPQVIALSATKQNPIAPLTETNKAPKTTGIHNNAAPSSKKDTSTTMTTNNSNTTTNEDVSAELARLRAENEALRKKNERAVTCKVSEKGVLSIYGLSGRFPSSFYISSWDKLMEHLPDIQAFVKANRSKFAVKE